jgi:steroid delta-isomerase-like uncharacterized protein
MSDENVRLMKRWYEEVWNQGRAETIYEMVAPDCQIHGSSETGGDLRGPGDFAALQARLRSAFPDIKITVEDCFGVGDKVVARWSAEMRHTGSSLGIQPTGAAVKVTGATIVRFLDGKAIESWDFWDKLGMFQQMEAASAKSASA